ncbi:MAG: A/G-specific adenine glycosylase [Polyangiaceae bacterium]|nr:A/G-specific adenine glycosylase [Polyangiaceae bacterium]
MRVRGPLSGEAAGEALRLAVVALVTWYRREGRALPWRSDPAPYRVWVSEVMLQQTQVATVRPYFDRFLCRFPTVTALAAASEDAVLQVWQGLGYYTRARALHAASRRLVAERGGELPRTVAELRRLPGIGPYTAGAIASIAFGAREPVVDGNVARVLTRWFALGGDPRRQPLQAQIWSIAERLVGHEDPGDVNQALMELGAILCTPRSPVCAACPIAAHCHAHRLRAEVRYPELAPRPRPQALTMAAGVAWRSGRVLVVRAPEGSRWWSGLWHFPVSEVAERERPVAVAAAAVGRALGRDVPDGAPMMRLCHAVTRYRIELLVFSLRLEKKEGARRCREGCAWRRPAELEGLAMPAPHRRVARAIGLAPPAERGGSCAHPRRRLRISGA